jgi:selenocysteine-specific elongation factor
MIIGTAGHIDHGKTSLVHALTGVDTDRLKEEKARGISIDLGFAYLPAPDGSILGFVDVPGHEKFVHNMVAGATGVDFVLLVVAADDGPMPQTFEHLAIVDLLGVKRGVVALTKADLAAGAAREEAESAIRRTLAGTTLAGAEIIPVSTITGEGIDALREHLFDAAPRAGAHSAGGRFRLAVDRSFSLPGVGAVVTGTVLTGSVDVDDRVTISPRGIVARVRSIHAQNRVATTGRSGERCALNLAGEGVSKDAATRGDIVLDPSLHAPTDRIDATLRVLAGEKKPIGQWTPVRLHHAAAEVGAHLVLFADQPVDPGSEAFVQLVLERTIAAAVGDRFILRHPSDQRTIGGGRFLDLRAPARKRRTPERLDQLAACALEDPAESLATLLVRAPYFVDFSAFARDRALADGEREQLARELALAQIAAPVGVIVVSELTSKRLDESLLAKLAAFHADNPDVPGIGMERLRLQLEPRLPTPAFTAHLRGLAQSHAVALDGAWVRLPQHSVSLTSADERLWMRMRPLLAGDGRFRPPRVREVAGFVSAPEADVRRLMKLIARMGKVDEVAHDHFFLRETVAEMAAIMLDLASAAPDGQFTAAQLRDRLDNGRKVAIQVLEFFDRHGVSLRRGDRRRMNKHRLDLFRMPTDADHSPLGREAFPVGRPDFKSGRGREPVSGGFDSHSLPPFSVRLS